MEKTNENKEKWSSYLSAVKSENGQKTANQKALAGHDNISDVLEELKQIYFTSNDRNNKSELAILEAATEYIRQDQKRANEKNNIQAITDMNLYQGQSIAQPVQHMGLQPPHEMSAMINNFPLDMSTFAYRSGQRPLRNDTAMPTNVYHGGDHSYNSTRKQWSTFNLTGPST